MRSWSTNRARQMLDVAVSRFRPHSQGTRDRRQALDSLGAGNSHDQMYRLRSHQVMPRGAMHERPCVRTVRDRRHLD